MATPDRPSKHPRMADVAEPFLALGDGEHQRRERERGQQGLAQTALQSHECVIREPEGAAEVEESVESRAG